VLIPPGCASSTKTVSPPRRNADSSTWFLPPRERTRCEGRPARRRRPSAREGRPAEAAPLRPPPATGDRRSRRAPPVEPGYLLCLVRWKRNDVFYATRLLFDPGSETAGCAHPRRSPSYVEEPWSPNLARCS
jgi:hypothetical protein